MKKIISNLMMLNKIIIFIDSMIEDTIDGEFFYEKVNYDITFTNYLINHFWDAILRQVNTEEKDNFLRTYFFILKRFYKLLYKINNDIEKYKEYKIDKIELNDILENCNKKIKLIKEQDSRMKLSNTEKQFINQEEYSLLFQKFEEDE